MLSSGETNRRLARHLGIAERTVRAHTASIVRKLSLRSKFEAALVSHLHAEQLAAGLLVRGVELGPAELEFNGMATPAVVP
ncbi:LuxR C-terminal-related transcriptional regulator, partial [Streptomyces sp. NPDC002454]